MSDEVYRQLREQLHQYSVGYPPTDSGVEIRILKRLFTEEEAEMFLNLSMMGESAQAVAARLKQDPQQVERLLEQMAQKGLLFRLRKKDSVRYSAIPFIVGIYEFQLKNMDRELARMVEQYLEEGLGRQLVQYTPPLRPVAVNRSIDVSWEVAPYEDVRQMIKSQEQIAVAKCICRLEKGLLGKACDKPLEVCLSFGPQATYYVDLGMARWISQEEALEIMDQCEEVGLVPQPNNSQRPLAICNCCGCCCGVLVALKKLPRPAEIVLSNYHARVDPDLCTGCETCLERCQMEAIVPDDAGVATVDLDRCIGCGLCVTTCPTEALTLKPKSKERRREPPPRFTDTMIEIARKRGTSLIPLALQKNQ